MPPGDVAPAAAVRLAASESARSRARASRSSLKGMSRVSVDSKSEQVFVTAAIWHAASNMAAAALRFYIYPDAAYDFSAVLECHPSWIFDDQAAEVAMLNLLRRHPSRVNDPDKASLFVVPLLPYVSNAAGECMGESHEKRMSRAVVALRHSPYFKRRYGHDHVLITNTFRVKTFGFWLKPLLGNSTVAWFEQPLLPSGERRKGVLYSLAFWRCTVLIPYLANPFCTWQREAAPEETRRLQSSASAVRAKRRARPAGSVFFQGSWAAAHNLRRHFSTLQSLPGAHVHEVPRECNLAENASQPMCVAARLRSTRLHTARGMLSHEFCLIPRGDTPTSGRLFAALACRCVPVIISNRFVDHLPFAARGGYDQWTVTVPEGEFLRTPREAIERAISRARPKLTAMRAAMEAASGDLLYDVMPSRVADNFLQAFSEQCNAEPEKQ